MTREEFSQLIAEARKNSGIKLVDICADARILPINIERIEKAKHNFGMDKCLAFLRAINCSLNVTYCKITRNIKSYNDLIVFVLSVRVFVGTQRDFAKRIGVSHGVVGNNERKSVVMSVDTFLKIAKAMQIEIKIEANE